jgi:hypothetical protein
VFQATISDVKILTWNLNHRAARRSIPIWVSRAIVAEAPDVVVLTEYVAGADHDRFLDGPQIVTSHERQLNYLEG